MLCGISEKAHENQFWERERENYYATNWFYAFFIASSVSLISPNTVIQFKYESISISRASASSY